MLWLLLVVEVGYVVSELAFNSALLNVASGVTGSPAAVSELEHIGRLLSGFGLGLLIYGFLVVRKKTLSTARALVLLLVFPPAIAGMYGLQTALVEGVLVPNASMEERFAAQYVAHLNPAIREGLISIEGVPLGPDTINRPESKAFLTLAPPLLLQNDRMIEELNRSLPEILKYRVYQNARAELDTLYKQYQDVESDLVMLWFQYQRASREAQDTLRELIGDKAYPEVYQQTNDMLTERYQGYLEDGIVAEPEIYDSKLSPWEFVMHPAVLRDTGLARYKHLVRRDNFTITRNHGAGPKWLFDGTKAYQRDREFRANIRFTEHWIKAIESRVNVPVKTLGTFGILPLDIPTQAEFMKSDWVRQLIEAKSGITLLADDIAILPNWSKEELFNKALLPNTWAQVRELTQNLPDNLEDFRTQEQRPVSDQAIRLAYVPAIALAASLLFSFLTLGKIVTRVLMIIAGDRVLPAIVTHSVHWGIPVVVLSMVAAAPLLVRTNTLSQTEVLQAAVADHEQVPSWALTSLHWTLQMEPALYPIGNTVLKGMSALPPKGLLKLGQYHDPNSRQTDKSGGEAIETVALGLPLPVSELQATLRDLGHRPGPIDGVLGNQTVEALKRFQRSRGLAVTGRQDQDTAQALRTHRTD